MKKLKNTHTFPVTVKEGEIDVTYSVSFAKMTRTQREEFDIYYSKRYLYYINAGIMPAAVLQKKMLDAGAALDPEYVKKYSKMQTDLDEVTKQLEAYAGDTEKQTSEASKIQELLTQQQILELQINEYKFTRNNEGAEHTAEKKAWDDTIRNIMLTLSLKRKADDEAAEWTPFFSGANGDERLADMDEKEESEDQLYLNSLSKLYVMSFLAQKGIEKPEDIKSYLEKTA